MRLDFNLLFCEANDTITPFRVALTVKAYTAHFLNLVSFDVTRSCMRMVYLHQDYIPGQKYEVGYYYLILVHILPFSKDERLNRL